MHARHCLPDYLAASLSFSFSASCFKSLSNWKAIAMGLQKILLLLAVLCVTETLAYGQSVARNSSVVNIQVPQVSCVNVTALGILCDGDSVDDFGNHTIQMTTALHNSTGHIMFRERIPMLDPITTRSPSFSSSFTFRITQRKVNGSGDGMAFFMVGNASYRGLPGSTLGVYRWNDYNQSIFAIEYDTYCNQDIDPSNDNNHVGVDLQDIYSKATVNVGRVGVRLLSGVFLTTWIDYDSLAKKIEVRIANGTSTSAVRPEQALLGYNVDLSKIVKENMTMGISASTGGGYHEVLSMSLATTFPYVSSSHGIGTAAVIGIAVGGAFAGVAVALGLWWIFRGRQWKRHDEFRLDMMDMPTRFSYQQLRRATNEFKDSSRLGQGGTSSVYRGVIPGTGQEVAVKKVESKSKKGEKQFLAEIKVVSRLRHRNLVKLLGWCIDDGNYLLVYELMPNGSLDKHLHGAEDHLDIDTNEIESSVSGHGYASAPASASAPSPSPHPVLPWSRRLSIIRGVAAGLAYLHDEYVQRVIHRDIKSSNVMLDEEFNARLGDFGLARFIDHSKNLTNTQLAGTIGYIAPEVILTWKSTDKTDVYAFGILLLEIVCAKRPIEAQARPEDMILVDYVWNFYSEESILNAVDPRLGSDFPALEASSVLLIGLLCCHPDPDQRPTIRQVQQYLDGDVSLPVVPSTKPIFHIQTRAQQQQQLSGQSTPLGDGYPRQSSSNTDDSLLSFDSIGNTGRQLTEA